MRFTTTNQLWKSHHGLYDRFSSNPRSKTGFYNLGWELNYACPYLSARPCNVIYRVRESGSKLELVYRLFKISTFCVIFFGPRHMFEQSLKLSLRTPKWLNALQVLRCFSFLLRVTYITFAHATNTDVWQAIVARATECRKNCSKPL